MSIMSIYLLVTQLRPHLPMTRSHPHNHIRHHQSHRTIGCYLSCLFLSSNSSISLSICTRTSGQVGWFGVSNDKSEDSKKGMCNKQIANDKRRFQNNQGSSSKKINITHKKNTKISKKPCILLYFIYMGVSKNSGTPKWMVYKGKPY